MERWCVRIWSRHVWSFSDNIRTGHMHHMALGDPSHPIRRQSTIQKISTRRTTGLSIELSHQYHITFLIWA